MVKTEYVNSLIIMLKEFHVVIENADTNDSSNHCYKLIFS